MISYGYCWSVYKCDPIWLKFFFYSYLQMNDELRIQMAYLLRNYSVGTMNRYWMYLFSEVNNASLCRYNVIVCCSLYFDPVFLFSSLVDFFFTNMSISEKQLKPNYTCKKNVTKILIRMNTNFVVGFMMIENLT